jgi:hypothetical protein
MLVAAGAAWRRMAPAVRITAAAAGALLLTASGAALAAGPATGPLTHLHVCGLEGGAR